MKILLEMINVILEKKYFIERKRNYSGHRLPAYVN